MRYVVKLGLGDIGVIVSGLGVLGIAGLCKIKQLKNTIEILNMSNELLKTMVNGLTDISIKLLEEKIEANNIDEEEDED